MLLEGSNNRGVRGQTPNRSRGFRARGSTSRGASSSSANSTTNPPNSFESERLENSAKREQRGDQNGTTVNGRGLKGRSRGSFNNKTVRFQDPPTTHGHRSSEDPSPLVENTLGLPKSGASAFSNTSNAVEFNPFAAPPRSNMPEKIPSDTASSASSSSPGFNPFASYSRPSELNTKSNNFGDPLIASTKDGKSHSFGKHSSGTFGAPSSSSTFNPFATPATAPNATTYGTSDKESTSARQDSSQIQTPSSSDFSRLYPAPEGPNLNPPSPAPSLFEAHGSRDRPSHFSSDSRNSRTNMLRTSGSSNASTISTSTFASPFSNEPIMKHNQQNLSYSPSPLPNASSTSSNTLAKKIDKHLREQGIQPPVWPTDNPGDPKHKDVVKTFWQASLKSYRSKARASLIRAGFLDDPDKPKKLSEAIDFKGTCDHMCPEFEKFTRIVDHSVDICEKEPSPNGSLWPSMERMVKALARSAAGQDSPLPEDVRTPAALRRTLDYLLNTVLGNDDNLSSVHGFLWDRTRAIRRDFVFQSAMNSSELSDQIYCLERITRFHAIALHQMSRGDAVPEDFSEQQELEQLGKALLSLIHAYEDCFNAGLVCENEAEFRSYYVLFNSRNTGILETVQDWGWRFWTEPDIKTAVVLVEALQNTWEPQGPLKPQSGTIIAPNGFSRFFSIVEDTSVSYTMACFAEIHFNSIRKSALKTILSAYRKQRDQTKDWTLSKLNSYLRFDDPTDIVSFGEAYGLRFDEVDGEDCLSFDSDNISDPFPPLKQTYSRILVEQKRGGYSLVDAINRTVHEEKKIQEEHEADEDLFVKDTSPQKALGTSSQPASAQQEQIEPVPTQENYPEAWVHSQATQLLDDHRRSVFNQSDQPNASQQSIWAIPAGASTPVATSSSSNASTIAPIEQPKPIPPGIDPASNQAPSILAPPMAAMLRHTSAHPTANADQQDLSRGNHIGLMAHDRRNEPPPFFSGHAISEPQNEGSPESTQDSQPIISVNTGSSSNHIASTGSAPCLPIPAVDDIQTKSKSATSPSIQSSSLKFPKPVQQNDQKRKFDKFSTWFTNGHSGIIDQFIEFNVKKILQDTIKQYMAQEAKRLATEADVVAKKEADNFRHSHLATKYVSLWRIGSRRLWMRRTAREARQARREQREALRSSKASIIEDFVESTRSDTRASRSFLNTTAVINDGYNSNEELQETVSTPLKPPQTKRPSSSKSPSTIKQKRARRQNHLRRSLLSNPSYLSGKSRIHQMSDYDAQDESRPQVSGVQTDYFRLKARGIATQPIGIQLTNSATNDTRHGNHSLSGISKQETPNRVEAPRTPGSVPAKVVTYFDHLQGQGGELFEDNEILTHRAGTASAGDATAQVKKFIRFQGDRPLKRRSYEADEEELFARAKRVKEQMDEGSKWYRQMVKGNRFRRSMS